VCYDAVFHFFTPASLDFVYDLGFDLNGVMATQDPPAFDDLETVEADDDSDDYESD